MAIQRIASKWEKTKVLKKNPNLVPYIPDTRRYHLQQLEEMLNEYQVVFIKPDHGTYGNGVMSVELVRDELDIENEAPLQYKFRHGIQTTIFPSLEELHAVISEKIGTRLFLMQKGITMLTYQHRKFDIRILVQKNPQNNWESTGFVGRVAAPQKIITNYHGGGTTQPIEELLKAHLTPKQYVKLYKELKLLGVLTGEQLNRKFPRLKEIGIDIAIDEEFRPWILEVNTLPALFPFKNLKDKSIYKKIRKYAVAYGRLKPASKSK